MKRLRNDSTALRHVVAVVLLALFATSCAFVARVSSDGIGGAEPDDRSIDVNLSATGRYAVFASDATNLVTGDTNGVKDIFFRDNETGTTELVSISPFLVRANGTSGQPDVSDDGRYVVFWSFADNLTLNDTNGQPDVFLRDRVNNTLERVSIDSNGAQASGSSLGGSVSNDGRYVAFYSTAQLSPLDTNASHDVYRRDRVSGETTLISRNSGGAVGSSFDPVVSPLTGFQSGAVLYSSTADLISPDDTNGLSDVYLSSFGAQFWISRDGNGPSYVGDVVGGFSTARVTFTSFADNLVAGDTNGQPDVFISYFDFVTGIVTEQITHGNGASTDPRFDATGTRIAYSSFADDLQDSGASPPDTNGQSDVYLWDGTSHLLMSQTSLAEATNGASFDAALSADGSAIAYRTDATNLGFNDNNGADDIAIRQTFVPTINPQTVTIPRGSLTAVTLTGSFQTGADVLLSGDGTNTALVTTVSANSISMAIEIDPAATIGPRDLWVYIPAPQLGIDAPLGSANKISIEIT